MNVFAPLTTQPPSTRSARVRIGGDVGAGVGLGDRERRDLLAADRGREPALLLRLGAERRERRRGDARRARRCPPPGRPSRQRASSSHEHRVVQAVASLAAERPYFRPEPAALAPASRRPRPGTSAPPPTPARAGAARAATKPRISARSASCALGERRDRRGHSRFRSIPKTPRTTSLLDLLALARAEEVADRRRRRLAPGAGAFLARGFGVGTCSRAPARGRRRLRASRAASISRATRASTRVPYFANSGEAFAAPSTSSAGAMRDAGARSRVWTTGVGTPFSQRIVTAASPMPSCVQQLLEVVELGLRERRDGRLQRLGVVGRERAQRVLDAVAELREHVGRDVLRRLGDEEDADALGADQPHGLRDRLEERLRSRRRTAGAPRRRRRRAWACRGRRPRAASSNSSASSHISAVENSFGLSCTAGSSRHEMTPRPSGAVRSRSCDRRTAARRRTRCRRRPRARRARAAARRPSRSTARRCPQLGLALVGVEEGQQRAQVGEVEQRQALLVGVVEDEPEALLLRLVGLEDLREQLRPEVATPSRAPARRRRCRRATRNSTGKPVGANGDAELGRALLGRRRRRRPAPPGRTGRP